MSFNDNIQRKRTNIRSSSIGLRCNGKKRDSYRFHGLQADGVFIFIGLIPNTKSFENIVDLNERGFIKTTGLAKTSMEGVFAASDYREGPIAQVAAATGEGVLASYGIRDYLK